MFGIVPIKLSTSKFDMDAFRQGIRDGLPIGAGYFAVAFSLGIIANSAGMSPITGFISSFLTRASAGEYGVYSLIASGAAFMEIFALSCAANLRYLLMGAALTQKFDNNLPLWKRIICSLCITDEIFGISIAYPGNINVKYPVAATLVAGFLWGLGTASGIFAGNVLPANMVTALSVALYGMFIAVIIPPSKRDKAVALSVFASFIISTIFTRWQFTAQISSGTRIVILTIAISAAAAIIMPVKDED